MKAYIEILLLVIALCLPAQAFAQVQPVKRPKAVAVTNQKTSSHKKAVKSCKHCGSTKHKSAKCPTLTQAAATLTPSQPEAAEAQQPQPVETAKEPTKAEPVEASNVAEPAAPQNPQDEVLISQQEQKAKEEKLKLLLTKLERNMVYVAGGTFKMGATSEQKPDDYKDEKPVHKVELSSFSICKFEVTQELWEAVMGSNPSHFQGARLPVEQVSWNDCQEFIQKLRQLTGKNYRLPTEAEWEYAARGGGSSRGYKYSGGNDPNIVSWYGDNSNSTTHEVGTKRANELGLFDMSGNVWEWCQDWYDEYPSGKQVDPQGPSSGSGRVRRGGGWGREASYCRVSCRLNPAPDFRSILLGLRLAL